MLTFFSKHKKAGYVLFSLFFYMIFLIASVPANLVVSKFIPARSVQLDGVTGTIWNAEIRNVNISGIDWGAGKWEIHPLSLLLGHLSLTVSVDDGDKSFRSDAVIYPSGKIKLEEADFSVPLSALQKLTYGMPFTYNGLINGQFPTIMYEKNKFMMIEGELILKDLKVTSPQQMDFGNLQVDFKSVNEGLSVGKFADKGGPLAISGDVKLDKNSLAILSAKINARKPGSDLDKLLGFLGPKDSTGRVTVNYRYQLAR